MVTDRVPLWSGKCGKGILFSVRRNMAGRRVQSTFSLPVARIFAKRLGFLSPFPWPLRWIWRQGWHQSLVKSIPGPVGAAGLFLLLGLECRQAEHRWAPAAGEARTARGWAFVWHTKRRRVHAHLRDPNILVPFYSFAKSDHLCLS